MLRKRKTRGYNETGDEEEDGGRKYDIRQKIKSERFNEHVEYLQEFHGSQVNLRRIQRDGFERPILVREPEGLQLRVPEKGFLVRDVRDCVGEDRIIDVMDVRTQKNIEMTMKEWCKYYESKRRDRLLNVISLEFSHTELDELVEAPSIVRLLDWVDLVWPKFLKESQTESTNKIDKMKYPKVQKYCLMSVKGSYTDFHIDFGGTSVWYHILKGRKIFWMIPPTELNLQTFEEWTLSGMQQEVFFGDTVEECFRVELSAGNTFFIPSGWIHAVYTLEDSLVFGGNFLHSFGIENQLKVSKVEDATRVPVKFRYPFYTEIQWYVVQHYVHCLTGKDHLHPVSKIVPNGTPEKGKNNKKSSQNSVKQDDDQTEPESDSNGRDSTGKKKPENPKNENRNRKSNSKKNTSAPKACNDETEDDSATEIDTDYDSDEETPAKRPETCRMTKNSLLRLQYQIDQPSENAASSVKRKSTPSSSSTPRAKTEPKLEENQMKVSTTLQPDKNTLELDKILTQDGSTMNSWPSKATTGNQTWSNQDSEPQEPKRIYITKYEINGLKLLVKHLAKLSGAKKHLPALIRNSRNLLDDCKKLIVEHENDDPELAITGEPITLELLNPKKSDINQLIEQFFKPSETTTNDETQGKPGAQKTKVDSAPVAQSRLSDSSKSTDRKSTPTSETTLSQKEPKNATSPSKKATNSSTGSSSSAPTHSSTSTTAAEGQSTAGNPPRPKSPPTRPLSNNQYSSKTGKDNSLILPGSFAGLIAATSTEKKVFDVTGADLATSLYTAKDAIRSPTKTPSSKQAHAPKEAPNPLDILDLQSPAANSARVQSSSTPAEKQQTSLQKEPQPQKLNSPEPPKVFPPKRFINPTFRPQNKEKLIFASAPYISPVSSTNQLRPINPHQWQSHTPHQANQHQNPLTSTPLRRDQDHPHSHLPHIRSPPHETEKSIEAHPSDTKVSNNPVCKVNNSADKLHAESVQQQAKTLAPGRAESIEFETPVGIDKNISSDESARSLRIETSIDNSGDSSLLNVTDVDKSDCEIAKPQHQNLNRRSPPRADSHVVTDKQATSQPVPPRNDQPAKKPSKPRGPPKKSEEARQVVILSPPRPNVVTLQKSIKSTESDKAKRPREPENPATSTAAAVAASTSKPSTKTAAKEGGKVKRVRKQKETTDKPPPVNKPKGAEIKPPTNATMQSVICGLVAQPSQPGAIPGAKTTQQYLISRPLLFNTMPTMTSTHLQQLPRASVAVLPNALPASLSLPTIQQGARLVWATQPRQPVPTNTVVGGTTKNVTNLFNPPSSSGLAKAPADSAKKQKSNPQQSPNAPATTKAPHPPDNAALLSLATTALSTAPLATTPTLSYFGGVRSPNGQAFMVSSAGGQPALLTGQPFFNPFMQRLPLVGQYPPIRMAPTLPIPGAAIRPITNLATTGQARPTGQLVFARLPDQSQQRYLITQPFIQARPPTSTAVAGQPSQLAFAAFRPPCPENPNKEGMKAKKVKTR